MLKLVILIIYFAVLIGIGLYCRKHATDVNGFVLGGRSVGPWLTAFAYGTSYFSAVVFVGYAGQFGWKYGIAATWAGIGNAIIGSLLAWVVLGRRTRIMSQHLDSATMPQYFGKRFGSNPLKIGASVIIFIFLIPYTASLYNGLSRLFGMAFNIDYSVCIIIMATLTAIYVIAGGYMATAINDFIQGIIMLFGIVAVIAAVIHSKGGFMSALQGLANVSDPAVSNTPGIFASFFGPDPFNLLCVVILTSLGTWGLPQMVQKFYAIDNEASIQKGTVISTIFALIVSGGCYFLGGFGRLFSDQIDVKANGFDSIIPTMLSNLSPALIALVVILVLSASMSTLSSLVIASSSTLTSPRSFISFLIFSAFFTIVFSSFLSSGIDSSYLVSLARPDKTYTVGYENKKYSEIEYAKDLTNRLGITNISDKISKQEYMKAISDVYYHMDEPTTDACSIAVYFLSKLASKDVKVVLSGEGADEFFGGAWSVRLAQLRLQEGRAQPRAGDRGA